MPEIVYSLWSIVNRKDKKSTSHEPRTTTRKSAGFSLIEILLAVFLIVALATILFSSSGTLFTTRNSRLQSVASKIASKKIENLRNTDFATLKSTYTSGSSVPCSSDADLAADLQKLKASSCDVLTVNYDAKDNAETEIKHMAVWIKWNNDNGVQQTLSIDTLIYENGL